MFGARAQAVYGGTLQEIAEAGLEKHERVIVTPQGAEIMVAGGKSVLNFCPR